MSDMDDKKDENLGSFYMGRLRPPPQPERQLPPGLLTVFALFALAGILWYAYPRGAEKYADMDVPVVKADTSPIREQPESPGGMEVPHQDSTVFDPLEKKSSGAVEKLRPASEEPLDKEAAIRSAIRATPPAAIKMAPKLNLDLQMKDEKNGVEKAVPRDAPVKAEAKVEAKVEVEPVPVASGGDVYIQLGSYRERDAVKKDWERLKKKHPQFFGSLALKTERIDIPGKGVFYRLQAGKLTMARAVEVCTALKTSNQGGCILVRP
ncbi:MAG: SPOR domain-containing protein [Pseudomonadota bacterium]